ncbi:MAG TPA: DUF4912 domain-containing protein [Candidatus Acidoferrales bacterium]|jgi:hypothetical protein|nr:DUF4912 domain-containing protein [Candidatus Acidoferrales bacterium]
MRTKTRSSEEKEKTIRVSRTRVAAETTPEDESSAAAPKTRTPASKKIRKTVVAAIDAAVTPIKKRVSKVKISKTKKLEIPSILLEGDRPSQPSVSGPGRKYELGPSPVSQKFTEAETDLPEAYGTKKLFVTARDPHWLYANWDLTQEQQSKLNARSAEGHLILRVYLNKIEGHPIYEIHVHPESRHWFAHVERAGQPYAAELGYYSAVGRWTRVASSSATVTPPDSVSENGSAEFATIPFEFPFAKLMEIVKAAVRENRPLAQAVEELRRAGHPALPRVNGQPLVAWTQEQEAALAKIIAIDDSRRVWMGSLEITELIRRRLQQEMSSLGMMSSFGVSSMGISSFSSPFGGLPAKGFWFMVNAELIVYGATEPNAKVTLGGTQVKLRPDGSFSFRFALPDGNYDLPAVAVSADGTDARAADLKFGRQTQYMGDVGVHPQDPTLKAPLPENI